MNKEKIKLYPAISLLKEKFNLNKINLDKLNNFIINWNFMKENFKSKILEQVYFSALKLNNKLEKDNCTEEINDFLEIKHNREIIKNPEIFKEVDGIKFISNSEESLNRLINFYQTCKSRLSNKNNSDELITNLETNNCIITDLNTHDSDVSYCSYSDKKLPVHIYFDKKTLLFLDEKVFYHEVGHFYDMSKNMMKINKLIDNLDIDKEKLNSFLKNSSTLKLELQDIIKEELENSGIEKEKEKLTLQNGVLSFFFESDKMTKNLSNNIMSKDGYDVLEDIVQAVSIKKKIKLDEHINYGHDYSYYLNKLNIAAEVFANFTELYSIGKEKKLDEIFPVEFRKGLTDIYVDTVIKNDNAIVESEKKEK